MGGKSLIFCDLLTITGAPLIQFKKCENKLQGGFSGKSKKECGLGNRDGHQKFPEGLT